MDIPSSITARFKVKKIFTDGGSGAKTLLVDDGSRAIVLKYATWDGIGSSGIPWLRTQSQRLRELKAVLPAQASLIVPEVFEEHDESHLFYYTLQYFPDSSPLSVYFFERPEEARRSYLTEINKLLTVMSDRLYAQGRLQVPVDYICQVHLDKTTYRLSYLTKRSGNFFDRYLRGTSLPDLYDTLLTAPQIRINGQEYQNAPDLIGALKADKALIRRVTPAFLPEYAHGDGTLRNYLYLPDKSIAMIDVRGTDLPGNAPSRVCLPYEIGKMLRTFHLEIIRQNAFTAKGQAASFRLDFDTGNPAVAAFLQIREQLIQVLPKNQALAAVMTDEPQWLKKSLFAEAFHFLADASNRLESDPTGQQTLGYYLLGTMLLNDLLPDLL